eukprot:TRINITY_DN14648_c0_g1_i1.p1 TRINITY_DN14648_c0_g1~~TRINITY_DN14648_c0_g1_i1.p1  ORF type:complete len:486 (+),score=115.07 TRINITY_DN14648_c0_g1_i1:217-1458(+)
MEGSLFTWDQEDVQSLARALESASAEEILQVMASTLEIVEMSTVSGKELTLSETLPPVLRLMEDLLVMAYDRQFDSAMQVVVQQLSDACVSVARSCVPLDDEDSFNDAVELKTSAVRMATVMMRAKVFPEGALGHFTSGFLDTNTAHFHCFSSLQAFVTRNAKRLVRRFPESTAHIENLIQAATQKHGEELGTGDRCLAPLHICISSLALAQQQCDEQEGGESRSSLPRVSEQPTFDIDSISPAQGSAATTPTGSRADLQSARPRTVYVCGIDTSVPEQTLIDFASQCGELTKVRLCGDRKSPTVFGFFEYATVEEARRLVAQDQQKLGNKILKISFASQSIKDPRGTFLNRGHVRANPISQGELPVYQSKNAPLIAGQPAPQQAQTPQCVPAQVQGLAQPPTPLPLPGQVHP